MELPLEVAVPAGQAFASFALKTKANVAGTMLVNATLGNAQPLIAPLETTVVAVSISPPSASLFTGGQQQFTATVTGSGNKAVTWGVVKGAGSVNAAGLYTAPSVAGTAQVRAESTADPSKSATATVTITPVDKAVMDKENNEESFSFIGPLPADAPVGTAGAGGPSSGPRSGPS